MGIYKINAVFRNYFLDIKIRLLYNIGEGGDYMELGDLISLYRKQAGMTIDELSEKSKVPKGTLNKIIGGITKAPTLDNVRAIARALGKTLDDFDDNSNANNKKALSLL